MNHSYVFIGPSITKAQARVWLGAQYLPPVSQGDIVGILRKRPQVIGIIDGYFNAIPAVWHKEILLALAQGVRIVGGASMGALRAAELYPFGMTGVGEIFEWYRDGKIQADDEVAVLHAPAEYSYRPKTEALVNMRQTLQRAHITGVITQPTHAALLAIGQCIHYTRRSYRQLITLALTEGVPADEVQAFEAYVEQNSVDQKHQDAIAVLQYIARIEGGAQAIRPLWQLQYTDMLDGLIDRDSCIGVFDGLHITVDMLINHARLHEPNFVELRARALESKALLHHALRWGLTPTLDERRQTQASIVAALGLTTQIALTNWRNRNHMTEADFDNFIGEWVLIARARQLETEPAADEPGLLAGDAAQFAYTYGINADIIRQLHLEDRYGSLFDSLIVKEKIAAEQPGLGGGLGNTSLYEFYFGKKQIDMPRRIVSFASRLGFSSMEVFDIELKKYCQYLRCHETDTSAAACDALPDTGLAL